MSRDKKTKEQNNLIKKNKWNQLSLFPKDIVKAEVNFLAFPFFTLGRKSLKNEGKIEYSDEVERNNQRLEISWQVLSSTEYGLPTNFDKKVHRAIEQIINRQGIPIENPVTFSLYQLCKIIGIVPAGDNIKAIKKSLERIVATTVKSDGAFYLKEFQESLSRTFHLYDQIVFRNQRLSDGSIAETNYLSLGEFYLKSLNAFYVKNIDFKYYHSLKYAVAQRLYEILGVKFYGSRKYGYVWFKYPKLCQVLPITPQRYLSNARTNLSNAHNILIETEFLEKVEWSKTDNSKTWTVTYYPGSRAKKEMMQALEKPRIAKRIVEAVDLPRPAEAEIDLSDIEVKLELEYLGILSSEIEKLIKRYKQYRIAKAIVIFRYLQRKGTAKTLSNPAGYVIDLIKKDEPLPRDIIEAYQHEKEMKEEAIEQALYNEKREEYNDFIKAEVDKAITAMSEAELKERRNDLKKELFKRYPQARTNWKESAVEKNIDSLLQKAVEKKLKLPSFDIWQEDKDD